MEKRFTNTGLSIKEIRYRQNFQKLLLRFIRKIEDNEHSKFQRIKQPGYFLSMSQKEFDDIALIVATRIRNSLIHSDYFEELFVNGKITAITASQETNSIKSNDVIPASLDKTLNWLIFFSVLIMPDNNRDASVGDIEEKYNLRKSKFGAKKAKMFIIYDLCSSIKPILYSFLSNLAKRLLKLAGLFKLIKLFL